jgi:hypothetical protein
MPQFFNRYDAVIDTLLKYSIKWRLTKILLKQSTINWTNEIKAKPAHTIEIVSHCWQYSHLLAMQISSLLRHPPAQLHVIYTVFYSQEDTATRALLIKTQAIEHTNITWHWQPRPKEYLFRRAIGRNQAALNTHADWIWFTDCDLLFGPQCFDSLMPLLQNNVNPLVFPEFEHRSPALTKDDVLLQPKPFPCTAFPFNRFIATRMTRATGPLQIVHGDVARRQGYCHSVYIYQKPAHHWCKANEDRVFRWLLGSEGTALPIQDVYRIQHQEKGRYSESAFSNLRRWSQTLKMFIWKYK